MTEEIPTLPLPLPGAKSPNPLGRACMLCGTSISGCMGSVLPRDILSYLQGKISGSEVRELCGLCLSDWDYETFVDPRPLPDL